MPSDTLRQVTGTLTSADASPLASTTTVWQKIRRTITAQGTTVVVDASFEVDTDASGQIDTMVYAGNYLMTVPVDSHISRSMFTVPDEVGPHDLSAMIAAEVILEGDLTDLTEVLNRLTEVENAATAAAASAVEAALSETAASDSADAASDSADAAALSEANIDTAIADAVLDEDDFATNSATRPPSQQSTAAYIGGRAEWVHHYKNVTSSGTAGGTFTSGAYVTRALNAGYSQSIPGASFASNQFTLPAGVYEVWASAPAYKVGFHKARLYNVTDAVELVNGTTEVSAAADGVQTRSFVNGLFSLAGTRVVELQHRCQTTRATDGLGVAASFGNLEVQSDVFLRRLS